MANTGKKIVLTLKEVVDGTGAPTGNTKSNTVGEADYIAPYTDFTDCPIVYDTVCPTVILSDHQADLAFEFALKDSVIKNPSINQVTVELMFGSTPVSSLTFTTPFTNYFTGSFANPGAGSYTWRVTYLDNVGGTLNTCAGISPFTIT